MGLEQKSNISELQIRSKLDSEPAQSHGGGGGEPAREGEQSGRAEAGRGPEPSVTRGSDEKRGIDSVGMHP